MAVLNKKALIVYLLLLLILSNISGCRCSDVKKDKYNVDAAIIENQDCNVECKNECYEITSNSSSSQIVIKYTFSNLSPNTIYSIFFSIVNGNADIATLKIDDTYDINANVIKTSFQETQDSIINKHPYISNGIGEIAVTLSTKIKNHKIVIPKPIILNILEDNEYAVLSAEKMEFIFLKKDIENNKINQAIIKKYIDVLSELKGILNGFSGKEDLECYKITKYVFTEDIPYTGLAGTIIYIDREKTRELFLEDIVMDNVINKSNTISVLCHELSHTYDICNELQETYDYCFDKELFATLKEMYALSRYGFKIDYDFLSSIPRLESGIYNYEVFLQRILKEVHALESNDWYIIQNALYYQNDYSNMEDSQKVIAFLNEIFKNIDEDSVILPIFTDKELSTIIKSYE